MEGIGLTNLLTGIIPLVVPILIYVTRLAGDVVPGWGKPFLALGLGAGLDYLFTLLAGCPGVAVVVGAVCGVGPVTGALLGGLGVVLRDVVDQLKKATG